MGGLDFILGLTEGPRKRLSGRARGAEARLVEIGREVSNGQATRRLYLWSTGRIGACVDVDNGAITIGRQYGHIGDGKVGLTRTELHILSLACEDWLRRRDEWAAFFETGNSFSGTTGMYFQPPGKDSKPVEVWSRFQKGGNKLRGNDEVRRLPQPIHDTAVGLAITADIWHFREVCGDPAGERIGVVYMLGADAEFHAQRRGAEIFKSGQRLGLEPDDEEVFVRQLLMAAEREGA